MSTVVPNVSAWPFAPGESPFRIKGTAYRGHMEFVAEHVPGGVDAMLAALPDDGSRAFFETRFLASTYYDIFPLVAAAGPCGRLTDLSAAEFVTKRSRDQAPKDLGGVYRFVLAMVPTGSVARRLPRLLTQVCDFASPTVLVDQPGHVEAAVEGVPVAIAPWLCAVLSAYGETALLVSGAKTAAFVAQPTGVYGEAHGVPTTSLQVQIHFGHVARASDADSHAPAP